MCLINDPMKRGILVGFGFMGGMHAQSYAQIPGAEAVAVVDPDQGTARPKIVDLGLKAALFSTLGEGNVSGLGGYLLELSHFIECLETGTTPRTNNGPDALASLKTALAEIRSAESGQPEPLSQVV